VCTALGSAQLALGETAGFAFDATFHEAQMALAFGAFDLECNDIRGNISGNVVIFTILAQLVQVYPTQ